MTEGVTPLTKEVYGLHMTIFWICVVIGIGVFGALFWSIIMHRRSKRKEAANFHESHVVELIWTVIPFIILIAMAVPATKTLIKMENTDDAEITVKATGYQWMWGYDYLEDDISFYSRLDADSNVARQRGSNIDPASVDNYLLNVDKEVVLPTDTKIRILTTAADVIHSWWVPELGGKRDAIPGFINEMWFVIEEEGVYRGQCTELCGKDHGFMPIVVRAVSPAEYQQWVASQKQQVANN